MHFVNDVCLCASQASPCRYLYSCVWAVNSCVCVGLWGSAAVTLQVLVLVLLSVNQKKTVCVCMCAANAGLPHIKNMCDCMFHLQFLLCALLSI